MKNNLSKFLALTSLLAVGVLSGAMTTFAAGAREYETPPCYDITGSSTAVLVNGVANGGVMDFDDAGVPAAQQACVRMKADNVTPDRLEGWVWNSNLGWVSLYCPGGVGALNLDIACGTQAYGPTFTTTGTGPNFSTASLSGYAWGDNIGWISFNNAFSQIKPISSGINRGLVSGASADVHTWSDSVGWLNLTGVHFYWEDTDPPMTDPDVLKYVSVCSSKDPLPPGTLIDPKCTCDLDGTCAVVTDPAKLPDADGGDKYDIKIPFVDGGVALTNAQVEECGADSVDMYKTTVGGKPYCGRIALTWEDDVDYDQTVGAAQTQSTPKFNSNNNGATRKPLTYSLSGSDFTYTALETLWGANVKSFAPTSDANLSGTFPNEKFYYPNPDVEGVLGSYDITKTSQNLLKLREMKLILFKYSTGPGIPGTCIYGNINSGKCDLRNYMTAGGTTLGFKPLVKIDTLDFDSYGKALNFIPLDQIEVAQKFSLGGYSAKPAATSPAVDFKIGLSENSAYALKLLADGATFPLASSSDPLALSLKAYSGAVANWYGQVFVNGIGASISNVGPYLFSTVSYNVAGSPNPIKYFSNKLPRIKAGLLKNPVAKVQGNVYLTDFQQKASDVSIRSLGNIASNLRREVILRNVSKYLSGFTGAIVTGNKTVASQAGLTALTELVAGKVYYLKDGNLTLDCGASCTFNTKITIIVENGNIYVNSDLRTTGDAQLGLIALRNLQGNVQTQGYLYLEKGVGWLQNVHIYLDKVLQSYNKVTNVLDPNGFQIESADDYARQDIYKNQLVFEGTLSSMNGIGNASRATPTYETGAAISPTGTYCSSYRDPATGIQGICRARVVDLNYLRYYGPGLEICLGTEGTGGAVANVPRDQALKAAGLGVDTALGCNPAAPGYDIDATDLYDAATAPNMDLIPGGTGGVRSQYFVTKGLPATLANEFPVNFFYKSIAKDLAGFEVDQSFDQTIQ